MAYILVCDDEPEIVKLVSATLSACGHMIAVARDGQEALDQIAADPPDLLVIDLQIPRLDGLEVTRRLRAAAATARLPIVLMMARIPTVEEVERGGPDEYLVKPFLRELLIRNVERLLEPPA